VNERGNVETHPQQIGRVAQLVAGIRLESAAAFFVANHNLSREKSVRSKRAKK